MPDLQHGLHEDRIPYFMTPQKTIHLVAGTAGIELGLSLVFLILDGFDIEKPHWSALRELSNGFVSLDITKHAMKVKFLRLGDSKVLDEFWILQPVPSDNSFARLVFFIIPAVVVAILYSLRSKKKNLKF